MQRYLVEYFGEERPLHKITSGEAEAWKRHLLERGLADNTVRRACGIAKQWFRAAVKWELIDESPFAEIVAAVRANTTRYYFVSQEEAAKVLEACPDAEWRLLFALARYGGLRIPSEALVLRWEDVNWDQQRIRVHSPKTEHHEGGAFRTIPIFPELRPHLEDAFELAEPGAEFCITRYRSAAVNLRTQLIRILKRANLEPWPKLWQNLRSSRETELADRYPLHVVTAWIGNSVQIAAKHYLQVTEEHMQRALQNPVQQAHASNGNDAHGDQPEPTETAICGSKRDLASDDDASGRGSMGATGLEPVTSAM